MRGDCAGGSPACAGGSGATRTKTESRLAGLWENEPRIVARRAWGLVPVVPQQPLGGAAAAGPAGAQEPAIPAPSGTGGHFTHHGGDAVLWYAPRNTAGRAPLAQERPSECPLSLGARRQSAPSHRASGPGATSANFHACDRGRTVQPPGEIGDPGLGGRAGSPTGVFRRCPHWGNSGGRSSTTGGDFCPTAGTSGAGANTSPLPPPGSGRTAAPSSAWPKRP
jgi:hypothetical protein